MDSLASGPGVGRGAPVKSADRTVQLLEALAARDGRPARLKELVSELRAPRSSVYALLRTLVQAGWVRTDPDGSLYTLGLRALLVGTSFLEADPYVRAARPVLADLRDKLGETVHLARLDQDRVVYLLTQESGREPRRISRVGRWLPAHAASLGKALLAERGELPDGPLERLTPATITDPASLAADLAATRERGYAVDVEENTPGLRCVGLALRYTSPATDAISCSAPTARMTPEKEADVVAGLTAARDLLEESAPLPGTF
ncbi:MAG: IclR family transcriptional regulator [Bifidobacteriaceae bacterium]|jgi:DNA-binding IclR family transcriptional regulator|nr:IclR family transcriptional regulator [Bifidobacteriaceae bacterium]